jgi:16S rRNA G966 N2-methylase RsmD
MEVLKVKMTTTVAKEEKEEIIIIKQEYENFVQPQTPAEYRAMKESIKQDGQLVKGVKNQDNVLIDGHHRYKACKELGILFKCETRYFENEIAELQYIHDVNDKRRHYNEFQRAEQALKLKSELAKKAKENKVLAGKGIALTNIGKTPINVQEELARGAGVSKGTLNKVDQILSSPFTTEQNIKDLQSGKTTISRVYNSNKMNEKRIKIEADIKAATKGLHLPDKIRLYNMDSTKLEDMDEIIKDNSIDLIMTDPPYAEEYLYLYEGLAKLSEKKLREGGSVVFFFGRPIMREILETFKNHGFDEYWPISVIHEGPGDMFHPMKVRIKHKPMLWFVKGGGSKRLTDYVVDDVIYSEKPDKTLHPWAQSQKEAKEIIEKLTASEHSQVLDPFLGSGVFAIPAIQLNRYFIGIEIDKQKFENAKNYLKMEVTR